MSIASEITRLQGAKSDLKTSIENKGVTVPSGTKIDGYSALVDQISTGATLQSKSVTPTESAQTVSADVGYDGLSSVSVGAISSTYIGSDITQRSSSDLTASGATVTAPSGYYAANASKAVASGSASTPATTVTANPSISVNSSGLITASVSATKSVTPTVSAGYVSSGTAGTITVSGSNTQQLTTKAAATYTPTTSTQTIASGQYLTGAQTINPIPSEYIIPSGSTSITSNGTFDVTSFASAIVNVSGGGGSGLEYETGTYTPTADIAHPTISFTGSHSTRPFFVAFIDTGSSTIAPTDSGLCWYVFSFFDFCNSFKASSTLTRYGRAQLYYKTSKSDYTSGYHITSLTGTSTSALSYHLSNTEFYPYTSSASRYFRSTRSYKWIAVWI